MSNNRIQLLIAAEAAKIIATEGQMHYGTAKRKAANRITGNSKAKNLPSNQQIESALREHQKIFGGTQHQELQTTFLKAAIDAMTFFDAFQPCLTGSTLEGTAEPYSRISLHLFAADTDDVLHLLLAHGIKFKQQQRRIRWQQGNHENKDFFQIEQTEQAFELAVFKNKNERPICPVSGLAQRRANIKEVKTQLKNLLT